MAITMPSLSDFAGLTVRLRCYHCILFIDCSAGRSRPVSLHSWNVTLWHATSCGKGDYFSCHMVALQLLSLSFLGNSRVLLPADPGKSAQGLWGKEGHNAKARRWAPSLGPALKCTLQSVFCSPFLGEFQYVWPISSHLTWINISEMLSSTLQQLSERVMSVPQAGTRARWDGPRSLLGRWLAVWHQGGATKQAFTTRS